MHPLKSHKRFYTKIEPENLDVYQLFFECEFIDEKPAKKDINEFQKSVSLKWKALKICPKMVPKKSDLLANLLAKIERDKISLKQTISEKASKSLNNFFKPKQYYKKPILPSTDILPTPNHTIPPNTLTTNFIETTPPVSEFQSISVTSRVIPTVLLDTYEKTRLKFMTLINKYSAFKNMCPTSSIWSFLRFLSEIFGQKIDFQFCVSMAKLRQSDTNS